MNGLVLEAAAGDLVKVAISSIAVGSVVLAGVWLAGGVLLRRRPAARHLILNAALLVYLLGPLWILAARALPDGARQVMQPAVRALAFLDAAEVPLPAPGRGGVAVTTADPNRGGLPRGLDVSWLLGLWALGSALLLGRLGFGWARVRRMRLAGTPPAPELDTWVRATLARGFPGRSVPPVRISAMAGSPLVVGTFRPVILLPAAALELDSGAARAGAGARDGARPPRGPAGGAAAPDRRGLALAQPAGAPVPAGAGAGPGGVL